MYVYDCQHSFMIVCFLFIKVLCYKHGKFIHVLGNNGYQNNQNDSLKLLHSLCALFTRVGFWDVVGFWGLCLGGMEIG